MRKIYISGKIGGLDLVKAKAKFANAEKHIRALGLKPVNPLKIKAKSTLWQDHMRADIKALMDCDAVYALPCWTDSKGAIIEVELAKNLGIEVIFK